MITSGGYGVGFDTGATLGTLANSGTISGDSQGLLLDATGTVNNLSGGLISGGYSDGIASYVSLDLLDNAGSVYGATRGVHIVVGTVGDITSAGSITGGVVGVEMVAGTTLGTLTNSGTVNGGQYGVVVATTGTVTNSLGGVISGTTGVGLVAIGNVGRLDNAGLIQGGDRGVETFAGTTLGTLMNSGTMTGGNFGAVLATTGTVTNLSGSLIQGTSTDGIVVLSSANLALLDNAGTITGGIAAVRTQAGASIDRIANTGTMGMIVNGGTIGAGVAPAISSTGRGAVIGSIINAGTINQGFLIENQDVSVGTNYGVGVFNSGTLTVVDGNLTFTDGTIRLNADVSVNGGTGTLFNQAILALSGSQTVTGDFQQLPGGMTLFDLHGVTPGTYGHLGISGTATFGGDLALDDTLLPGGLSGGQTFELFDFASATGSFTALFVNGVSLTSLGGGQWAYGSLTLTEVWTLTTMSLTVTGGAAVPEIDPNSFATAFALLVGAFGLLERKGRRLMRRARND